MTPKMISIAKDFSPTPAGRYLSDGPKSGELFREKVLRPALDSAGAVVTVDLDGALGYGSSFLEEAFGGLVRSGYRMDDLRRRLHIRTQLKIYQDRVWRYIADAEKLARR